MRQAYRIFVLAARISGVPPSGAVRGWQICHAAQAGQELGAQRGERIVRHAMTSGCVLACLLGLTACTGSEPATVAAAPVQAVTVAAFGPVAPPTRAGSVALSGPLPDRTWDPPAPAPPRGHPDRAGQVRRAHLPRAERRRAGLSHRRRRQARPGPHPDPRHCRHRGGRRVGGRGAGRPPLGANESTVPLVIYTSSLLREGAPLATPDPP